MLLLSRAIHLSGLCRHYLSQDSGASKSNIKGHSVDVAYDALIKPELQPYEQLTRS